MQKISHNALHNVFGFATLSETLGQKLLKVHFLLK